MPLYLSARALIRANLELLVKGERPPVIEIGCFTAEQHHDINVVRRGLGLHELESTAIVYMGRHHFTSRTKDGYCVSDLVVQIETVLSAASLVLANPGMTALQACSHRADGYGNHVRDLAIFELSQRKPRAELYSVIPKGDTIKPRNAKGPPQR